MNAAGLDLESVSGGASAAQAARRAGHAALADIIAAAAREQQLTAILAAVTDEAGAAAGVFDSLADRLGALLAGLRVEPPPAPAGLPAESDVRSCAICMEAPIAAALRPCFHAALCVGCADSVLGSRMRCPLCRAEVEGVQRLFFA